jgi:glycosyltransferase involved in cell wall biosynthesis
VTSISVALATYNGSKHLGPLLDSLARQEQLPDELIVSDDDSTDGSVERVEAFTRGAPFPVRLSRNRQRLGYRTNFLKAAAACRSELIAFCDQDDVWEPRKLTLCAAPFADPDVLLVYHDALAITGEGLPIAPLHQLPAPAVTEFLAAHPMDYALGFTQVFRRSLLGLSELWTLSLDHKEVARRERMAHDQWFFFLASALGRIVRLDGQLVHYRQHESNSYGWSAGSRVSKIIWYVHPSLRGRADEYRALEAAANCRAVILGQVAESATGLWRSRGALAAQKYHELERLYRGRRQLYESIDLRDRITAFCGIFANRGYRAKRDWGLGHRALLTDLCLGLPAGYRLSAKRKASL